jgi:hypothetical protein
MVPFSGLKKWPNGYQHIVGSKSMQVACGSTRLYRKLEGNVSFYFRKYYANDFPPFLNVSFSISDAKQIQQLSHLRTVKEIRALATLDRVMQTCSCC